MHCGGAAWRSNTRDPLPPQQTNVILLAPEVSLKACKPTRRAAQPLLRPRGTCPSPLSRDCQWYGTMPLRPAALAPAMGNHVLRFRGNAIGGVHRLRASRETVSRILPSLRAHTFHSCRPLRAAIEAIDQHSRAGKPFLDLSSAQQCLQRYPF